MHGVPKARWYLKLLHSKLSSAYSSKYSVIMCSFKYLDPKRPGYGDAEPQRHLPGKPLDQFDARQSAASQGGARGGGELRLKPDSFLINNFNICSPEPANQLTLVSASASRAR